VSRHFAPRRVALAGLLGIAASACGHEPPPPVVDLFLRVEISGHAADKPWPAAGFRLRSEDGREIPLETAASAPGAAGPVLEGRGKPGRYTVVPPATWGVLGGSAEAVDLRPDVPPVKIGVGRDRTIYTWPPVGKSISTIRCARDGEVPVPVDAESVIADDGSAALRVPAAEWHGVLRVLAVLGPSTFAESTVVAVDKSPRPGAPWAIWLAAAPAAPVHVRVVRPSGEDPSKAVELMASVAVAPLQVGIALPLDSKGAGVLEDVPREVTGLSLFVRGSQAWEALDAARVGRDVRLFVSTAPAEALGVLEVRLSDAPGAVRPVLQIRAEDGRPGTAPTYAVPSFTEAREGADGFRVRASLPAGRYRVLALCGERGAAAPESVEIVAGKETSLALKAVPLATIRVSLLGGIGAVREWDLLARRLEGDLAFEGQGFRIRGLARADVDLHLPSGRYRLAAVVGGSEGRTVDVDVEGSGVQASVDLRPTK
jgi:hypothetical protein